MAERSTRERIDSLHSKSSTQQISSDSIDDPTSQPAISPKLLQPLDDETETCVNMFKHWPLLKQMQFVENLVPWLSFNQREHVYSILKPLRKRDFITVLLKRGMRWLAYKILSHLDAQSLCRAEQVCLEWYQVIADGMLWKKRISQNVHIDPVWKQLSMSRNWGQYLARQAPTPRGINHNFFRRLYPCIIRDIQNIEENWRNGNHSLIKIECRNANLVAVPCLQHDGQNIVGGPRVLQGPTGSVMCLQYDEKVIITGSSDSTIRVWDINSGQMLNTLVQHSAAVLNLSFRPAMLVTCSSDRTIAVWNINSPKDIRLLRVLSGHRAPVTVVDFDDKYIVSGSADRMIKVWRTSSCEFVRTLYGHTRVISCLQYKGNYVVSGSFDNTIRIWDVESGACLRVLGHEEPVTCLRFDDKRIVSGAYGGTIKVWDLEAALDPRTPTNRLCLSTISEYRGRIFKLELDNFHIVSSSHDGTILILDYLDLVPPYPEEVESSPPSHPTGATQTSAHRLDSASSSGRTTPSHPIQEEARSRD